MKPNILISESDLHSFSSDWMIPMLSKYFNVLWDEHHKTHDKSSTIIITGPFNQNKWYKKYIDLGYKIVQDDLWDQPLNVASIIENNILKLRLKNWIWYNESLWWRHLNYHNYNKQRNNRKHFLLLMNQVRMHRNYLEQFLSDYLSNSLYSYVGKGIHLPGDIDVDHGDWQRYMNPDWFNDTVFSLVAETSTIPIIPNTGPFISEKTFKPIAFKHPFIITGTTGTLAYLKSQGFETYDHIVDESYDDTESIRQRLKQIVSEVERLIKDKELFQDNVSLEKAEHNFNLFYNDTFVKQQLENTIIKELLDYAET